MNRYDIGSTVSLNPEGKAAAVGKMAKLGKNAVLRGSNNPKVAAAARGRATHKEFANKVKGKPGWQSESTISDLNGKKLRPDVLTPSVS